MNRIWGIFLHGSVAQSVEQQPFKLMVAGSSPARPTIDLYPKKWTRVQFFLLESVSNQLTKEQIAELKQNPCVFECRERSIHYTPIKSTP